MINNHMVNHVEQEEEDAGNESDTLEELEFRENIERHSTQTRTVKFQFVGDMIDLMTDLKKMVLSNVKWKSVPHMEKRENMIYPLLYFILTFAPSVKQPP